MLRHPAVELTQAEDAVGGGARADLASPAAVSGSDDVVVLIVGVIAGSATCVTLLSIVCLVIRRRSRTRRYPSPARGEDNCIGVLPTANPLATATTMTRGAGGKEGNITTAVVNNVGF